MSAHGCGTHGFGSGVGDSMRGGGGGGELGGGGDGGGDDGGGGEGGGDSGGGDGGASQQSPQVIGQTSRKTTPDHTQKSPL